MTLRVSDLQSDSDLDSIRNSCDVCIIFVFLSTHICVGTYFFVRNLYLLRVASDGAGTLVHC